MKVPYYYTGLTLVFIIPLIFLFLGYLVEVFLAKSLNKREDLFGYIFIAIGFVLSFIPMAKYGKNINIKYTIIDPVKISS